MTELSVELYVRYVYWLSYLDFAHVLQVKLKALQVQYERVWQGGNAVALQCGALGAAR